MAASFGGQAVLEGVMMRGPSNWAVAVRKPDGDIAQVSKHIDSAMKRHRLARLPVIRGIFALGESLAIGFRALAISANYAAQEESDGEGDDVPTELSKAQMFFAFAIAIGFAIELFKVTPALLTKALPSTRRSTRSRQARSSFRSASSASLASTHAAGPRSCSG